MLTERQHGRENKRITSSDSSHANSSLAFELSSVPSNDDKIGILGGAQSLETAGGALDFLRETMYPFTQRDIDTDETAPG